METDAGMWWICWCQVSAYRYLVGFYTPCLKGDGNHFDNNSITNNVGEANTLSSHTMKPSTYSAATTANACSTIWFVSMWRINRGKMHSPLGSRQHRAIITRPLYMRTRCSCSAATPVTFIPIRIWRTKTICSNTSSNRMDSGSNGNSPERRQWHGVLTEPLFMVSFPLISGFVSFRNKIYRTIVTADNKLWIYAGYDGNARLNDMWTVSLVVSWLQPKRETNLF